MDPVITASIITGVTTIIGIIAGVLLTRSKENKIPKKSISVKAKAKSKKMILKNK